MDLETLQLPNEKMLDVYWSYLLLPNGNESLYTNACGGVVPKTYCANDKAAYQSSGCLDINDNQGKTHKLYDFFDIHNFTVATTVVDGDVQFTDISYGTDDPDRKKSVLIQRIFCGDYRLDQTFTKTARKNAPNGSWVYLQQMWDPVGCGQYSKPHKHNHNGGLTGGGILVIVFLVMITTYLAGGILVSVFVFKQPLDGNAIPNRDMWTNLFGLVKDGISYAVSKVTGGPSKLQYEQI